MTPPAAIAPASPTDAPPPPRPATAWDWAGHLFMLAGTAVVGLFGCGLAGLVVWVGGLVWREIRRAVAWSAADAWWMLPLWLAVAAFSFAIPVVSVVGFVRRLRRGPVRPPVGDESGNVRGAVLRRGRGAALGLLCLPLTLSCLWIGFVVIQAFTRGPFEISEAVRSPYAWIGFGGYWLLIVTSSAGLVSAARTVFTPPAGPPPGGTWADD